MMSWTELYTKATATMREAGTKNPELVAARATLREIEAADPESYARLEREAERVTFERRRYSARTVYCWMSHPDITAAVDPWPSTIFPKAVVMMELARAFNLERKP